MKKTLLTLLLCLFSIQFYALNHFENSLDNGIIVYSSPEYCQSSPSQNVIMIGFENAPSGIFSASPSGLMIDPQTGTLDLYLSAPGTYIVTYSIPPNGEEPSLNVSTVVTVVPVPYVEELPNITACDYYILPFNAFGNYYTGPNATGTQLHAGDVITSTQQIYVFAGDDSIECTAETSFMVSVAGIDSTTTLDQGTITANQSNAEYQWWSCDELPGPVEGATSQSFTPLTGGNYAVVIQMGICTTMSECVEIGNASTPDYHSENVFIPYPNPAKDVLNIRQKNGLKPERVNILDITGKTLLMKNQNTDQIDVSGFAKGVYMLRFEFEGAIYYDKFIKE